MRIRSEIVGCGSYLPERVVTNAELSAKIDTTDEWIVSRTGIRQRHLAADGELTSDLALKAAERALENAAIPAAEVDMLILATTTPDNTFPATATKVQNRLGMVNGAAFDVQAVCSGFVYGLAIADNFIKTRQCKTIVLIGAETFSRILDWEDRSTCVLFGDGAGAVVLRAGEGGPDANVGETGHNRGRGVLSTHLHSDGSTNDLLYVDGGPSSTQTVGHVRMVGRVLEVAAGKMVIVLEVGGRDQFTGDDRPGPVFIDLRQLIEDARLEGLALLIGLVEADHRNGEDLQLENTAAFRSESGIVSARHPQP